MTGRALNTRSSSSSGDVKRRKSSHIRLHHYCCFNFASSNDNYFALYTYLILSEVSTGLFQFKDYISFIASVGEPASLLRSPPPWRQGSRPSSLCPSYDLLMLYLHCKKLTLIGSRYWLPPCHPIFSSIS